MGFFYNTCRNKKWLRFILEADLSFMALKVPSEVRWADPNIMSCHSLASPGSMVDRVYRERRGRAERLRAPKSARLEVE